MQTIENKNSENKVVEYEIITTKKYRQVVKVQFDEKYSEQLDETKITPSYIDFGEGEEVKDEKTTTFSTKIVNESPDRLITYLNHNNEKKLGWGNYVPDKNKVKSVLVYVSRTRRGKNNTDKVIFLSCSTHRLEELWKRSNLQDLSSYIVSYDYLQRKFRFDEEEVGSGYEFLSVIDKKRNGKDTFISLYEVQDYIESGWQCVFRPSHSQFAYRGGKVI